MSAGRFKGYDYAVMGLFVLVLIGVTLSWYTVSISFQDQSLEGGDAGWHYAWGILAFIAGLFALIVVGLKGLVGSGGTLPDWYKDGPLVMGLGDLVTLFAIIAFIDKPGRGVESLGGLGVKVGFGIGLYLTLIGGLLIGGCGILAQRDKPLPATAGPGLRLGAAAVPSQAGAWQAGPLQTGSWQAGPLQVGPSQAEGSPTNCLACGAQLDEGSRFCRSCGRPQG